MYCSTHCRHRVSLEGLGEYGSIRCRHHVHLGSLAGYDSIRCCHHVHLGSLEVYGSPQWDPSQGRWGASALCGSQLAILGSLAVSGASLTHSSQASLESHLFHW